MGAADAPAAAEVVDAALVAVVEIAAAEEAVVVSEATAGLAETVAAAEAAEASAAARCAAADAEEASVTGHTKYPDQPTFTKAHSRLATTHLRFFIPPPSLYRVLFVRIM